MPVPARLRPSSGFARLAFALALIPALAAPSAGSSAAAPSAAAPSAAAPSAAVEAFRLRRMADSLWVRRDYGDAVALYARVIETNPADGLARLRLGAGLEAIGRDAEAEPHLVASFEQGFGSPMRVAHGLARIAARAGRVDDALDWLDRALAGRFEDRATFAGDSAFVALWNDPRFLERVGRPKAATDAADRVAGWRADLRFVRDEARRLHAAPDRPAWSPGFERDLDALAARVPGLGDAAVALELQRILAGHLGDGHSAIYPLSTARVTFHYLPLGFWFFADGLHVVRAPAGHESLVGRRVTAIGGRPASSLPAALAPYVSRDNEQGLYAMGLYHLVVVEELMALGFADRADRVTLTVEDAGGTARDVVVAAVDGLEHRAGLPPPPGRSAPAWLARVHEPYWHEDRPELDALYVQFNQVRNADSGPTVAAWARALKDLLETSGRRNLILDLRHNHGGNNTLLPPLLRLVAWHEAEGPGRRTYAITSRATFSAAQNLVNHLERHTSTVFVGEESSSKPNFAGEDTEVILPWSGLRLSISSRWWQDGEPGDRRPYVPVALKVVPTSGDWREGRDPVLAALAEALGTTAN